MVDKFEIGNDIRGLTRKKKMRTGMLDKSSDMLRFSHGI